MSKQERVVCAAVKVIGFHVEPFDRFKTPIDYVLSGVDHKSIRKDGSYKDLKFVEIESEQEGFLTNKNRFVDPVEAMKIAVKADQVGGASWRKIEIRMLNEWGITNDAKRKKEFLGEKIKGYLDFPLLPEDLY